MVNSTGAMSDNSNKDTTHSTRSHEERAVKKNQSAAKMSPDAGLRLIGECLETGPRAAGPPLEENEWRKLEMRFSGALYELGIEDKTRIREIERKIETNADWRENEIEHRIRLTLSQEWQQNREHEVVQPDLSEKKN
jgi:hypothetical protein